MSDHRPYIDFGREVCSHLEDAERREWLVTNGLGGYAAGTVAGTLTRRYHGLLIAALEPPLRRTLLVAKLETEARYDGHPFALHANRWADGTVEAESTRHLLGFHLEGAIPVWTWALGDALLEQRIFMVQGANTTVVHFRVRRSRRPVELVLRALVDYRGHHGTSLGTDWRMGVSLCDSGVEVRAHEGAAPFWMRCRGAEVSPHHTWYRGFLLPRETYRGLEDTEDHLDAAHFRVRLADGEESAVVLTTGADQELDPSALLEARRRYEAGLLEQSPLGVAPAGVRQLVLAADQFVVRRATEADPEGLSLIAGYPWFGDWGRDTMIALPGLLLTTGRHEDAARLLRAWATYVDEGMLPNRFPEAGSAPEYNSADAALWLVEAVRVYHAATGDAALVKALFPVLAAVMEAHERGTRYGLAVDESDGLLRAGEPGTQLTWMDAKVGDWVVTPRVGKPVEINALWYNALCSLAELAKAAGHRGGPWATRAERVKASFQRFWNDVRDCLYDVLDTVTGPDPTVRPNQLFAVSLHHSPLDAEQQRAVLEACAHRLLTSHGLRSLDPDHPAFAGRYGGGQRERDAAYHQGTVWPWLLGPFIAAHVRVYGDKAAARAYLEPLAHHLRDHGLGTIAEIFDGDPPFSPRGCIAQAWSVAEVLRAWVVTE